MTSFAAYWYSRFGKRVTSKNVEQVNVTRLLQREPEPNRSRGQLQGSPHLVVLPVLVSSLGRYIP